MSGTISERDVLDTAAGMLDCFAALIGLLRVAGVTEQQISLALEHLATREGYSLRNVGALVLLRALADDHAAAIH